jgi:uncharacterized protein (DUF58 family)
VKPTGRGLATVVGGATLIGAGFLFGYPELTVLGAAALLAVACAVGYALWRPRLSVARDVEPERVTRGESCTQTLVVHNGSRLRAATLIAQDLCGRERVAVPLIRLRPGREHSVAYPVSTARRGVVRVGPLTVTRRDPLGLLGVAGTHGGTARVWVHPRSHPLTAVPVGVARSLDGRIDRVPHGSITFDALREYVIGDELRRVHWRTTARVGELMVREYVDTSLPRLVVLLDDRVGAYPVAEGFEEACEAAASVLLAAVREDLAVELLLVTASSTSDGSSTVGGSSATGADDHTAVGPAGARRVDAAPLLDRLAEAQLRPGGDLHPAIDRLRQYRLGDTLVFLTGSARVEDLAPVGALRPRYPTIVAGVFGDPAGVPPTVEGLFVLAVADAPAFAAAWDGVGRW